MNDFRKIAKFVRDNHLTVEPFESRGTSGGFDDYFGYKFFLGNVEIEGVRLTTASYELDEKEEVVRVLPLLEEGLRNLEHANVIDMESLGNYLKRECKNK